MERSTLDLWVGMFVVAGFVALTILALKVGNMGSFGGSETYQLSAPFTNIGGLKPRAAVKSAGVVVGRVADITFDNQNFTAKVTLDFVICFDIFTKLCQFWLLKIFNTGIWIYTGRSKCCMRTSETHPENVSERDLNTLFTW